MSRSDTGSRYFGVYTAVVAENGADDHPGEVRLRLDWFDPQMRTEWCRICNLYAGNGYGTVWHPEEGDEVLVAFLQGDMRWPIVLGGLYNGVDVPPTARSGSSDQKLFRTKGGHELLMDDTSGQMTVRLRTAGGHQVTLDDAASTVTIETSGGQSVTLEAGKVTVQATSVVLSATSVKLGGDSAAQSLVLGNAFMALFNAHTHNCTAPGSPSGPPIPQMLPALLSQVARTG
jgi:uncharacterized protein involved in type VI secretion and phage assembly